MDIIAEAEIAMRTFLCIYRRDGMEWEKERRKRRRLADEVH